MAVRVLYRSPARCISVRAWVFWRYRTVTVAHDGVRVVTMVRVCGVEVHRRRTLRPHPPQRRP